MTKGIVKPSEVLSALTVESQTAGLSDKLKRIVTPPGTPDAKVRVGYVSTFDPATWTVTAFIGDSVTPIASVPVLAGFQPIEEQPGMFLQTGGDGTSQYTLIGMIGIGSTGGGTVRIRKSADQTITNSATVTADTHLTFYAEAQRSYIFQAQLFVQQNNTGDPDFNASWLLPSGATFSMGGAGAAVAITGGNGSQAAFNGQWRANTAAVSGTKLSFGIEAAAGAAYDFHIVSVLVSGTIVMDVTGGLCSLGWCQNVAVASNTTKVQAGSWLKVDATSELLP